MLSKSTKLAIRVYCKEIFGDDDPFWCLAQVGIVLAVGVLAYYLSAWSGIPINLVITGLGVLVLLLSGADFKSILLIVMLTLMLL